MANFRLTSKEKKDYNNLLSTAKRRIKSAKEKGYDISNAVDLTTLSKIENREQFKELNAQLKTFKFNRNYKYVQLGDGNYVPEKDYVEVKTQNRIANLLREQKRKKIHALEDSITPGNVILSKYEYGQRASTSDIQDLPKIPTAKKIPTLSRFKQLQKYMKEKSDKEFLDKVANRGRDNFLKTLEELIPGSDEVVKLFKEMDVEEFWFMYKSYDEFARIFYGSKQDELEEQGITTSYQAPKITELLSKYDQFQKEKEKAKNKR